MACGTSSGFVDGIRISTNPTLACTRVPVRVSRSARNSAASGYEISHEAAMQTVAGALAMRENRRDQAAGAGFTSNCRQTAEHRRLATQLAQGCQK
jgi:hypothetical protein